MAGIAPRRLALRYGQQDQGERWPRWLGAGSESATQAKFRADDAKCNSYGAEHGTDDYVQCRLAIDMQKANAERAATSLPGGR